MDWRAIIIFLSRYVLTALAGLILLRTLVMAIRQWVENRSTGYGLYTPFIGSLIDEDGYEYPLEYDNILGSSRRCDIRLNSPGVARVHAQIYLRRKGLFLQPFSRSETLVNQEPVTQRCELMDGDEITLGESVLTLMLQQPDEAEE